MVTLIRPSLELLYSVERALELGWCPEGPERRSAILRDMREQPQHVIDRFNGSEPMGPRRDEHPAPTIYRLSRWIWDGEFSGIIGLCWLSDSGLPPSPEGHVGYNIIPWKRNRGYAKSALSQLQAIARGFNIPYLELVTDMANLASQKVVLSNGGLFIESFLVAGREPNCTQLRYRIPL